MGDTQTSSETLDAFQDSNNQDDAHDWDLGVKKDNKKNDESKKDTSDEPDQDDQASQGEPNLESAMKDLNAQKTGTIISGDDFAKKSSISLLGSAVNSFEKVEGGFKVDLKWAGKMGARVKALKTRMEQLLKLMKLLRQIILNVSRSRRHKQLRVGHLLSFISKEI